MTFHLSCDTAEARKSRGAFFTPPELCRYVAGWAIRSASDTVLEPSCGEAAFLLAAGERLDALAALAGEIRNVRRGGQWSPTRKLLPFSASPARGILGRVSTTRRPVGPPPDQHPPPPPGHRWVKIAIRVGVPVLIVGILLTIKPEIITGTLETTGAMLRVGALLLGWLVFAFLVRRFVRPPVLRTGLITVVGLALVTMTVLPYFINTQANDTLLTGPATASTQDTPGTPVDETSQAGETSQAKAVKVTSGRLKGLAGHRGSGAASIVRTPDGSHVVQLENYDVSSGVILFLYVVPGANQDGPGANGINLGKLAENTGNRVVPIPAGTDLSGPQTVLIWCEPFTTPIAAADQAPV